MPSVASLPSVPALKGWGGALAIAVILMAAAWPAAACQVARAAQVPIAIVGGFPFVPVLAAGRTWPFLIDTGAQDHLVTPAAAAAMGLVGDGRRTHVLGTASAAEAANVGLRGLSIGGVAIPTRSVPAATLPGFEALDPAPAGILGLPFLAAFDLLIDGPGRQMALYAVQGCAAVPVPFTVAASLPFTRGTGGEPLLRATVNGRTVAAIIDTGARGTALADTSPARGALRFGNASVPTTITRLHLAEAEALLGWDYLGARRVWISFATGRLIVSGPVR